MVHSYLDNVEYGYDQINVGSSDYTHILRTLDANSINKISTIREREMRLFNKLNTYQPLQTPSKEKLAPFNPCKPDLYNLGGDQRVKLRHNVKEDVEKYYYGTGNNFKDQLPYPHNDNQCTRNYPWSVYTNPTPPCKSPKQSKSYQLIKSEGFHSSMDDMEYLQEEMDKMEQKNNMLTIFIFFLVIIVIVQYAKTANDHMQVLVVPIPEKKKSESTESSTNES